jgi:predicted phosphodiesterase
LEAVLGDAGRVGATAIWNIGDFVGYGPWPDEGVTLLRGRGALSVVGNYDLKVVGVPMGIKTRDPLKALAFKWAHEHTSPENLQYLHDLPRDLRLELCGRRILLTHGSPYLIEEHLTLATPVRRLCELAEMAEADVIVVGHSHQPFARKAGDAWFINTGSVGRSDDGDPRACYAVMAIAPGYIRVEHRRLDYDIGRAVEAIRQAGLPEEFAQMIIRGRPLDEVAKGEAEPRGRSLDLGPSGGPSATTCPPSLPDRQALLDMAVGFAKGVHYEPAHAQQVLRLARRLFEELAPVHGLGERELLLLELGTILHDIGWSEGQKGHNKVSMRLILESPLPLDMANRRMVACIARYHRKRLPAGDDREHRELEQPQRRKVDVLAGIVRVADGLDNRHLANVRDLACRVSKERVVIACRWNELGAGPDEIAAATKKGDLLELAIGRKLRVE